MKNILLCILCVLCTFSNDSFARSLIAPEEIKKALIEEHKKYKYMNQGKNADYIPELAKVNPSLFGIAVATIQGDVYSIGDDNVYFAIESIVKLFLYALALQDHGGFYLAEKVGLNATGYGFNSITALKNRPAHLENPYVNAGAIQTTSLIKGANSTEKRYRVLSFIKKLSDGMPYLGVSVYRSEMATNKHNMEIAQLLYSYHMIKDPLDTVDRYTEACSIMITARQLALIGATLANGGIHPLTHERLMSPRHVRDVLSEMVINGLYENSGAWFWAVGIAAKSGVGGGILAVIPHKMAIVVYSPRLDKAGNSVRAQKVIEDLAKRWRLHLLSSED